MISQFLYSFHFLVIVLLVFLTTLINYDYKMYIVLFEVKPY